MACLHPLPKYLKAKEDTVPDTTYITYSTRPLFVKISNGSNDTI